MKCGVQAAPITSAHAGCPRQMQGRTAQPVSTVNSPGLYFGPMAEFTLLMGADIGDPPATFAHAVRLISGRIGTVLATSRDHWTEPWGFKGDRLFLNRALLVETSMPPRNVMEELLAIERQLGRVRPSGSGYASRTIDLDILFIGEHVIDAPGLTVPHPRVHQRAFALGPAADLVPDLVHPVLGHTVLHLLNQALNRL